MATGTAAPAPTSAGSAGPEPTNRADGAGWGYRAHLDGLRSVAVYLVVAFHAGVARLSGGFIGVDVFFVLSGYLVTTLLTQDLRRHGGVGFARFYSRRARRLLPAAAVNLVITAVVFAAVATPVEFDAARRSIRAAALYVSNWWFIGESADYFGTDIEASPVAHYWSLSVEEQFYVLWPLALAALWALAGRAGRHRHRVLQVAVAGLGLTSLAAALRIGGDDLNRAYYGTDTRAYQLLAGALLALAPGAMRALAARTWARKTLPLLASALLAGLVFLGTSQLDVSPITRGALVTAVVVALLVALEAPGRGAVRSALSWGPVVYLGKVSYGTYLWHWLVILVLQREAELSPRGTLAVTVVVATGLASLSYQVLEQPIRISPLLGRPRLRFGVIAAGLAASAVVAFAVVPRVLDDPRATASIERTDAEGTPVGADEQEAFFDFYDYGSCETGGPVACPLATGSGKKVLLVGDSHAGVIAPLVTRLAERHDLTAKVGFLPYCPWPPGIQYRGVGPSCFEDQADLYGRILPDYDPDIVILAHRTIDDTNDPMQINVEGTGAVDDSGQRRKALEASIEGLVDDLRADGRQVVIVEPVPVRPKDDDPITCLAENGIREPCRFVTAVEPTPEEEITRGLAERDGVWSLDLDPLVCPYRPICDPVVNGMVVWRDANHLTIGFATSLLDPVDQYLVDNGVLD